MSGSDDEKVSVAREGYFSAMAILFTAITRST